MIVLGIDTSCDDTAVAVVRDGRHILSSVIASQLGLHAETGGVVPEVASRRHLEAMRPALSEALGVAGVELSAIDAVAATVGPGLAGSLMVGYNLGRALALGRGVPFIPVNHLEGHIYSAWLIPQPQAGEAPAAPEFPLLVLIVSGGHTELVLMSGHGAYTRLGATRDDAAGEAFDKVGRLLGLPYPGGPAIQRAAAAVSGDATATMPRAWLRGSYDFSFSGLKTAALHLVQNLGEAASPEQVNAIAAAFQESVAEVLSVKTERAARAYAVRGVALCGGVAANAAIREGLRAALPSEIPLFVPPPVLCTDNGAMIAAAGYYRLGDAVAPNQSPDVQPGLALPALAAT